ncbi:MAG TPA: hypothetical protein VIM51_12220 [Desulfosporosinus sp.]
MLKTYETFKSTVENFDKTIADLFASADKAELKVKDLQGQKVAALMTADVAGAVLISKGINDNQDIVSHNRESAELMKSGKWAAFSGTISEINAEKDAVIADALAQFNAKLDGVAKLKDAYMNGLAELGAIHQTAKDAAHDAAEVANLINTFEGNPLEYRHTNAALNWTAQGLYRPNKRDGVSPVGVVAVTENEQRRAYAPNEGIPNEVREG